MFDEKDIMEALKRQLAIDFNCMSEDFSKKENVITVPTKNAGRRVYSEQPEFFSMVTLGENAIISADKAMHEWLREFVRDKRGIYLFEHNHLMELETELRKYGKKLWQSHHMFLPKTGLLNVSVDFEVKWFEQEEIQILYGREEFSNALCEKYMPERPDMLAVAAMQGNKITALAGCSADAKDMWQIGIDVLPEYRSRGVGTKLVALLKDEIFRRGAVPFYGTSLSNLHSWNIALNCGFYPAWVEIQTIEE